MYPNRLTLYRWHGKSSTVKMEGSFNSFKVGNVEFPVTHTVPLASNLVVQMALEQMTEVLARAVSAPSGHLPMEL